MLLISLGNKAINYKTNEKDNLLIFACPFSKLSHIKPNFHELAISK